MRYQNTIHLDRDDLDKIRRGIIRIQIGQWVWLPNAVSASRYTGIAPCGTIRFLHTPITVLDLVRDSKKKQYEFKNQLLLIAV